VPDMAMSGRPKPGELNAANSPTANSTRVMGISYPRFYLHGGLTARQYIINGLSMRAGLAQVMPAVPARAEPSVVCSRVGLFCMTGEVSGLNFTCPLSISSGKICSVGRAPSRIRRAASWIGEASPERPPRRVLLLAIASPCRCLRRDVRLAKRWRT
jgi:hypothetical protein